MQPISPPSLPEIYASIEVLTAYARGTEGNADFLHACIAGVMEARSTCSAKLRHISAYLSMIKQLSRIAPSTFTCIDDLTIGG